MADEKTEGEKSMGGIARVFDDALPDRRLEDRVVSELVKRGLLRSGARFYRVRPLGIAAAVLLAFGAGWGSARWLPTQHPVAVAPSTRWIMLLYRIPGADAHQAERVAEYRNWAAQARDSGVVISGEKLDKGAWALSWDKPAGSWSDSAAVSGYFVVQAADLEKAMSIARSCPHVKYGGKVELRRMVPT